MTDEPTIYRKGALWTARRGLAVFPVAVGGKAPLLPAAAGGEGYHDATDDEEQVLAWWTEYPEANVGLPCAPNGLLVVDVDPRNGGHDTWTELLDGRDLPVTPTATTGSGGWHYLFRLPDYPVRGRAGEGVDVKVNGYIVVSPSLHPCGGRYRWEPGLRPGDVPFAEVPDWLEAVIRRPEYKPQTYRPTPASGNGHDRLSDAEIARRALAALDPAKADDYHSWVEVGMACQAAGDELLGDWIAWSSQSSRYGGPEVCEAKWRTFTPGAGIGVGTLVAWAREHGSDLLLPGSRRSELAQSSDRPQRATTQHDGSAPPTGLPRILVTNRPFDAKVDDATAAVQAANSPPDLFLRSGELVEVRADEGGWPIITRTVADALRTRMARAADWYKLTKGASGWSESTVDPPKDVVNSALADGRWDLPALEAVTQVPTLRPDGTLLDRPGYDASTRLFYTPPQGLQIPAVPDAPTRKEAESAFAVAWEPLAQFPYVSEADRAGIVALLLTPVIRAAIDGPVPMALIDAPQQGTGKSLLAETVALVATGAATFATAPRGDDDAEWRKLLTTLLADGNTIIGFDNVDDVLRAGALSRAITAPSWTDRVLGKNESIRLPIRATWIATGNNLRVGGDLARRCYRISIDAKTAEPWGRRGFAIPDLRGYVTAHRGELLAALLTMARAWYAAGQPVADNLPCLGSFEQWSRIVGGVLHYAGVRGFLANLAALYEEADSDSGAWGLFLSAWHERFGARAVTTKQVADVCESSGQGHLGDREDEDLRDSIPEDLLQADGKVNRRSMGKQLDRIKGRRYQPNNVRVEQADRDSSTHRNRWIVQVDNPALPSSLGDPQTPQGDSALQAGSDTTSGVCGVSTYQRVGIDNEISGSSIATTPQNAASIDEPALGADSRGGVCESETPHDPFGPDDDPFASEDPPPGARVTE